MEGYADDVKKWMQMPNDRIPALKKRRAILEREMVGLGAEADGLKSGDVTACIWLHMTGGSY